MGRPSRALALGAAAVTSLGAAALACGADTRQKVLPTFFDGAPRKGESQGPPKRRVRRDLEREIEDLKRALADAKEALKLKEQEKNAAPPQPPAEKAKTWKEAAALLPKDAGGLVDFAKAVKQAAIAPRPDRDPKAPVQAALELDVELSSFGLLFAVTFTHGPHTRWLACGNCHPAPFPLGKKGRHAEATMADMEKGRSCGACHGPAVFGTSVACYRCHPKNPARIDWRPRQPPKNPVERARTWAEAQKLLPATDGAPDWTKAFVKAVIAPRPGVATGAKPEDSMDQEVVRVPGGDEASKVVFPHAIHTALVKCDSCHPEPFEMQGGATAMSMEKINDGKSCGVCHGKVAFGADACARCHPAMGGK